MGGTNFALTGENYDHDNYGGGGRGLIGGATGSGGAGLIRKTRIRIRCLSNDLQRSVMRSFDSYCCRSSCCLYI